MKKLLSIFIMVSICLSLGLVAGCAKKVTKIEPLPEPAPVAKPEPTPAPVERETFEPVDPDAEARAVLQTVYFDYNKWDLKSESLERLTLIGKFLSDKPGVSVLMEGHCDERGSNEYNMGLGDKRARSISDWLVSYGIGKSRLETTSYGKERPARSGCGEDESCHAMNRRVEFKVLKK
jgi:peptidoglycan-associated lipoprotein